VGGDGLEPTTSSV